MKHISGQVEIWEESLVIPTYEVGKPDKNPMYLEKRVYQGSTGKVYPYPVIDKIYDEKVEKTYRAIWLENDFLRVMVLPELGGRIQRAYDKTNGYDFVYYNEVIKPALVGLTGPWVSGGIEFNWPQHHRPTTFSPVDCVLCENPDGSKTIKVGETDQMYGTKMMAGFTLYPDKAYIEIKGQLYNPTDLPQTFLWWANPAVPVNDHTQSIFPPDVNAVMDHGKRAVSKFPIATGEYYKYDYSEGVDISRYKNIPVPTSYMAYHSDYDFVGNYDYSLEAGILHIADHHISPGKKQWTWGCGDFGKAWDRNLTDENGPYIELMTGMFTDNQPDFTWLMPFEEKEFTQYFMPYKGVRNVKNASTEAALNLTLSDGTATIRAYATAVYEDAQIVLKHNGDELFSAICKLSPEDVFVKAVPVKDIPEHRLTLELWDKDGRLMLRYTPAEPQIEQIPEPAQPAKAPGEIGSVEELYLTGLHIEQYRHATYLPDPYYLEGLKRDPGESRLNNAYGALLLRRGLFGESEQYFRKAVARCTWKNPNPYHSEALYNLGLSLLYQARLEEAYDAFFKSTWSSAQQEMGYYYLAQLSAQRGDYAQALDFAEKSLVKNAHNIKARGLKAVLLRLLDMPKTAEEWLTQNLQLDPFDYLSCFEKYGFDHPETLALLGENPHTFISTAACYADFGCYGDALNVLKQYRAAHPLPAYYAAYYAHCLGEQALCDQWLKTASAQDPAYCFPNKRNDIAVLEYACKANPQDSYAPYYLGNLWYDKRQYQVAAELWEKSARINPDFPTVWRNLALAYYNKQNQPEKAQDALEKAFALDKTDARVFFELDQIYKKRNIAPKTRIQHFDAHKETFEQRDDLWVEYITLLNLLGHYEQAYEHTMHHKFHPWEGGEGKITTQYVLSLVALARAAMAKGDVKKAISLLESALVFPENLGEGKLDGNKDNQIYYYLGCAYEMDQNPEKARVCWENATLGTYAPASAMYYNDQPADLILYQGLALQKLGKLPQANGKFHSLVDYGEKHYYDEVSIDYFAVSLPDLQLFDDDLTRKNRAHCSYLIALGCIGLGERARAEKALRETLSIDCSHIGATQHLHLV